MKDIWSRFRETLSGAAISLLPALREVGVTAVVALTPVWAGALLSVLIAENQTWWGAVKLNTARGDLFLLAAAALAPLILYITVRRDDLPKPLTVHFPGGWFYIICAFLLFAIRVMLFTVKRLVDAGFADYDVGTEQLQAVSLVVYLLSIGLALIVTFTKERLSSFSPEDFLSGDKEFTQEWLERDRENGR